MSTESETDLVPPCDSAREVFLSWERLRLVYNVVLAVVVLIFQAKDIRSVPFLVVLAEGAVAANLCFCAGPVMEGYLSLLGIDRRAVRWLIFVPGLLLACLLTMATLLSWNMKDFD